MRIGILYEEMHRPPRRPDAAVLDSVCATERALSHMGHRVTLLPVRAADLTWLDRLERARMDLIFNLCEGLEGEGMGEFLVRAATELLGIPVTGCSADVLAFALRKDRVNAVLAQCGLSVPPYTLAVRGKPLPEWDDYPAIVKPAGEDGSLGIYDRAVVESKTELETCTAELLHDFETLLVQKFIPGREFNAGFVGERSLPLAEIDFSGMPMDLPRIVSYAAKWEVGSPADRGSVSLCPAPVDPETEARIGEAARTAWLAITAGRGYGRVDLRLDAEGVPYVIEVNPNPDFTPLAGLARMAAAAGWSYDDLVSSVCDVALSNGRSNGTHSRAEPGALQAAVTDIAASRSPRDGSIRLRPIERHHRERIRLILEQSEVFRYDEVLVGLELLDVHLNQPSQSDYYFIGAMDESDELVGYACYGPTPCTVGTWDLYWIVVDPGRQGAGIGTRLLEEVEGEVRRRLGRILLAETSSQPSYDGTRAFYARRGYRAVSRVEDFYAPGDDRVIFAKRFGDSEGGTESDG